jgi:hypothetical protein
VPQLADDHVKTVRTEVNRGDYLGRGLMRNLVSWVISVDGSLLNG